MHHPDPARLADFWRAIQQVRNGVCYDGGAKRLGNHLIALRARRVVLSNPPPLVLPLLLVDLFELLRHSFGDNRGYRSPLPCRRMSDGHVLRLPRYGR